MPHDPSLNSPRSVISRAFAAYEAARWSEFASLVHVDALNEFRQLHLRMAEAWETMPSVTAAGDDRSLDELEREFNAHFGATGTSGNPALRFFARVATVEELRVIAPDELLARYLEAQAPRARPGDPEYQPPVATREVIGEVVERPDLVHVVYRVNTDVGRHGRTEEVSVVPVRRTEDGWRLMLNRELALTASMHVAREDSLDA